jgi:hypothetical protein
MLAQKRFLGSIENLEVHTFGLASWLSRNIFPYGSFSIRDGPEIRFLEDKWLGNATFLEQYLALYNIV